MHSIPLAESAVLVHLHSVRMRLLVLRIVVIAMLTLRARQCDLCSHDFPPPFMIRQRNLQFLRSKIILNIKKKAHFQSFAKSI